MKKILFSTIAILALAVMGCNKSELVPQQDNVFTIKASIENFGTKTTMNGNTVIWEEGDKIAFFTNVDNDEPILFTLADGAGTPDGDFSTNVNIDGKTFVAALYPYDENARYSSDKITTNLASSYTWAEGANGKAPMAALLPDIVLTSGSNSLDIIFKNAGSLIALTVNNIPARYESISMTSGIAINGTTEISFTDGVPSSTVTATEEANKTTTINFAAAATTTDKVFYFPLGVTDNSTSITIKMTDGSAEETLFDNKSMAKAVRNKRYYTSISFDGMGNLPTPLAASEDINTKIGEGTTNFILDESTNDVNITEETTKDLQIAVTSENPTFELSGEGPEGKINLSTPAETENLTLDVPNATVELKPNEGFATYETVTAKTAANTLIIPASVTINNLKINGGNVRVYGKIVNIQRGENNADEKTIIYKESGAEIPEGLDNGKFDIVSFKGISTESELQTAFQTGGNYALAASITVNSTLTVPAGKEVTLDLNGNDLIQEKACTQAYNMIVNKGSLALYGKGIISFEDLNAGLANEATNTIRNEGKLLIELDNDYGHLRNLGPRQFSEDATAFCYPIDNYNSGNVTINSGTIYAPKSRSLRNYYTNGEIVINGGTFKGQVWIQQGSASSVDDTGTDKVCKFTITGGNFSPTGRDGSSVFITNKQYDNVILSVTGGTFNTKIGASFPAKSGVAGKITGGKFTESAKTNTASGLFASSSSWSESDSDGFYTYSAIQ